MKTNLREVIIAAKCRKGKAEAITTKGAYWLACEPIDIKYYGGDGIGQSRADMTNTLELRHYRDGKTEATVVTETWHQNHGRQRHSTSTDLLKSETVEDVVIRLKNTDVSEYDYDGSNIAYHDRNYDRLTAALTALGLPEYSIPSPDDEPAA